MTIDIRDAAARDEAALFALARAFPTPTPPDRSAFAAAFTEKISDRSSFVGIAEHDGELLGYVSGHRHATFYAGGPTAWVDELYVDEPFRNRGVGRKLMDAFEQWAFDHDCKLVGLATAGAAAFYQRLGYKSGAGYFKKYAVDNGV